jgi:LysR family glycine cleavage system transcriptional activator
MSSLAIDLALAGAGIALGQSLLASGDLAAGRLVAPYATSLPLTHPYCQVHPQARGEKAVVRRCIAWLRDGL